MAAQNWEKAGDKTWAPTKKALGDLSTWQGSGERAKAGERVSGELVDSCLSWPRRDNPLWGTAKDSVPLNDSVRPHRSRMAELIKEPNRTAEGEN